MAGPNTKLQWNKMDHSYAKVAYALSIGSALYGGTEVYAEVLRIGERYTVEIYRRTYGEVIGSPFHQYIVGESLMSQTPAKSAQEGKKLAEAFLIPRYQNEELPWREGTIEYERYVVPRRKREDEEKSKPKLPPIEMVTITMPLEDARALTNFTLESLSRIGINSPYLDRVRAAQESMRHFIPT